MIDSNTTVFLIAQTHQHLEDKRHLKQQCATSEARPLSIFVSSKVNQLSLETMLV